MDETAPRIADTAEIQHLSATLDQLVREEHDRSGRFDRALAKAKSGGPENPDHESLADARKLAKTSAEVQAVRELEVAVAAHLRVVQAQRDKEFTQELGLLTKQIAALDNDRDLDERQFELKVRELRSGLLALVARSGLISPAVLAQHRPLLARLDTHDDSINRRRQEESRLGQVTRQVGNAKDYQNALADYVKQFADSPRAVDFQRAIDEATLWEGMERWNKLSASLRNSADDVSATVATEIVKEGKEALTKWGAFPQAAQFRRGLAQLESVARRVGEDGQPIARKLEKLFSDALMANVWMVELDDGSQYYLPEKPELDADKFNYYVDFNLNLKTKLIVRKSAKLSEAPQSKVAKKALLVLGRLDAPGGQGQWEPCFASILKTIYEEERLDAILKIVLLKQTVEVACQGSAVLAGAVADVRARLDEPAVDMRARWMTPGDKNAATARIRARSELQNEAFARLRTLPETLAESEIASHLPHLDEYRWIAWLHRDGRGKWLCAGRGDLTGTGDLLVVHQPKPQGPVSLEQVGRLDGKEVTIQPFRAEALVEGRPVYLRVPAAAKKSATTRSATD